ncbi:MAG: hypothetical protein L0H00_04795 [Micrococcales bacterium]|nr:hypothetical protein [Micrococcales bacterium]
MSATNLTTNPAPLNEADARELTGQIAEGLADVHSLIVQAWEGRVWEPLGYETWDAWIDGNFRGLQLRPPREQRDEVVQSMREAGMSVRAISRATDLGVGTIHRASAGVPNGTPEQESTGLDGKSYAAKKPAQKKADESTGSMTLTDLGVPPIDRSTLRQATATAESGDVDTEALSGDVVEPEAGQESGASWWEGPREALIEAEARCVKLIQERKEQPRLVEDPQDPGAPQLTMTAARTVLAAGGVIVDLGVETLDQESKEALRKVLGTVIESLDGVIGDLEEADDEA